MSPTDGCVRASSRDVCLVNRTDLHVIVSMNRIVSYRIVCGWELITLYTKTKVALSHARHLQYSLRFFPYCNLAGTLAHQHITPMYSDTLHASHVVVFPSSFGFDMEFSGNRRTAHNAFCNFIPKNRKQDRHNMSTQHTYILSMGAYAWTNWKICWIIYVAINTPAQRKAPPSTYTRAQTSVFDSFRADSLTVFFVDGIHLDHFACAKNHP